MYILSLEQLYVLGIFTVLLDIFLPTSDLTIILFEQSIFSTPFRCHHNNQINHI